MQTTPTEPPMTRDRFVARFTAWMTEHAPFKTFDDGTSVADYAADAALAYWEDPVGSPEECAESDMEYWGE
jgi:hypothetical protein